ncbi:MAG: HAD family hydrolase [Desulfarculus sp.]|nr:MAG: HAD family hydrolase [Desulfarculus sp.]
MSIQALIFDFDGTLAELNIDFALMARRVQELARDMGFRGPWPAGYTLEQMQAAAAVLGPDFQRRAQEIIESMELEAAGRGRLFGFTRPLLVRAGERGLGLAVISRNCGAAIRQLLPEVDRLCQAFLPREAVSRPKPHPGHVLAACRALVVAPASAAMIGDHPTDVQAARAAGCLAVGVASGRVDAAGLREAGAQVVLPDAGEVLGFLEGAVDFRRL